MRQVIILSGVSGSGKSTYAEHLLTESQGIKVSADHYFTRPDGSYHFDASKLTQAHTECFSKFLFYLGQDLTQIVVDNTNLSSWEISPYILAAQAYKYQPEVRTLLCRTMQEVERCFIRNLHSLTLEAVKVQHRRLSDRVLPPFWKNTNYYIDAMEG